MSVARLQREVPQLALTQERAARSLDMSVSAFERHVKPHVACVFAGSRRLYPISELQRWLNEERVQAGRRVA
jgi:hypothetical protein